jgi:hypothetical protein
MSSGAPRKYPGYESSERTHYAPYSAFDIPADLRELHGRWDVEAVAQRVRNYRYAEEWSMRILGGWVATIPELPVKTGLGKIIWDCAQSADALGARLPELRFARRPQGVALSANPDFAKLVEAIAEPEDPDLTIEKLVGIFDVLFPHLIEVYEHNIQYTDAIADAPSIELLESVVGRHRRHLAWAEEVFDRIVDSADARERRDQRRQELAAKLQACGGVTGDWPLEPENTVEAVREEKAT